jgi:hypothetical protein
MREMPPNLEKGFPTAYRCSECGWSFPLSRLSDLGDFFQQKNAVRSFSDHDCSTSPSTIKEQNQSKRTSGPDSPFLPNRP